MKALVSFYFIFSLFYCFSHNSYFSFSELTYNELNGRFEASISMTTHDLEHVLQQRGIIKKSIEYYQTDTVTLHKVYTEILNHFQITFSESLHSNFSLKMDGFEIMKTGLIYFYASMQVREEIHSFQVTYDLLMNEYTEQQNKLTFNYRGNKSTYVFTPEKRNSLIEIP